VTITKTRSSNLLVAAETTGGVSDTFRSLAGTSLGTSWTTRANVYEGINSIDDAWLFPANTADNSDAAAIFYDRTSSEISLKMYDDSGNSWTESTVYSPVVFEGIGPSIDAVMRHSDGNVLVAFHTDMDATTDSLKTYDVSVSSIATPTITSAADVFANQAESGLIALMVDQNTDDIYAAYGKAVSSAFLTSVSVVYHKSSDGMSNWGAENAYSETADDYRDITAGRSVSSNGGRWQPVFFDDDDVDLYVNLVNDVDIPAVAAAASSFRNELLSPILFDLPFGNLQPVPTSVIGQEETLSTAVVAAVNRYLTLLGVGQ
jgi:hypothetical protein